MAKREGKISNGEKQRLHLRGKKKCGKSYEREMEGESRLRRQRVRGHAQLWPKKERGCSRMWAIALKLCLLEQLSWQMTLLHMDKRGLQATPHVSYPPAPSETVPCAAPLTCLDTCSGWK